ncbi:hypothetical protein Goklo_010756 [Gossypium klotzschianum]|uniref:Uncharacterized protein n=1 Tax=Gossypium klotzschianum TaxID=34286 RepID=A0A7J8V7X0_9ROSI|nr:hypothetical protein [Gossypium klotzschianum]
MPIATGHEREELAAELEVMFPLPVSDSNCRGKKIIEDVNNPVGPFGTKIYPFEFGPLFDGVTPFFLLLETGNVDLYEIEAPAVVKSYYDKRIVGCPGGEGALLNLCRIRLFPTFRVFLTISTVILQLEVVGPGGPPDGHGDNRH